MRTIFALASGAPPAGLAVIRVSGPAAGKALQALAGRLPKPRQATLVELKKPAGPAAGDAEAVVLDDALALWFPAPASFTGEDVAELHLHGGRAVIAAVCEALAELPGLSPAESGEFSRRAFENGKLDLTQAEGIADLVAAETEAQRRQALRQTEGALGELYENWRAVLVRALARLEADIDFAEDEELPAGLADDEYGALEELSREITGHLALGHRGERLREGIYVVVLGPTNAGKSSLINSLAGRDAAIVSTVAGTTRDVVEVHLDLNGYPVIVADTAGLRAAADEIENEGVRRALARAETADLKIVLLEADGWRDIDPQIAALIDDDAIVAVNKSDLFSLPEEISVAGRGAHAISVKTGEGLADLVGDIEGSVARRFGLTTSPVLTRLRHREALEVCVQSLLRFLAQKNYPASEMVAEDIRLAMRALGRITGQVDVEDLLDIVFSEFCIGK